MSMGLSLGLGLGGRRSNPVATFLAGTKGGLIDFRDRTRLWQDAGAVTPVDDASQPIGLAVSPGPVALWSFSQSDAGTFPTSAADGATFATDDFLFGSAAVLAVFQNVTAAFVGMRVRFSSLAADTVPFAAANNGLGVRFGALITPFGAVRAQVRRLDADSIATTASANGLVTTGVTYDIGLFVDYSAGTTAIRLDGA